MALRAWFLIFLSLERKSILPVYWLHLGRRFLIHQSISFKSQICFGQIFDAMQK